MGTFEKSKMQRDGRFRFRDSDDPERNGLRMNQTNLLE